MDPTRDNPIIRFNTFWWALWAFFAFAILLALAMILSRKAPDRKSTRLNSSHNRSEF